MRPSVSDLYLAYRQAKITLFFEKRGVGLLELAKYEESLRDNIVRLHRSFRSSAWFQCPIGTTYLAPKRVRPVSAYDEVIRIGTPSSPSDPQDLDIQPRLAPSPEFAIREILYIWQFGPALESILSSDSVGYRLETRTGTLSPTRRWLFEFWPRAYQNFRTAPLAEAQAALREGKSDVIVVTADLASFYDTIDPNFLLDSDFIRDLARSSATNGIRFVRTSYERATVSLLEAYEAFRKELSRGTGLPCNTGIPIGAITSRLVANAALATLDLHVRQRNDILCYRRYVDDIVIVARARRDSSPRSKQEILRTYFPLRSINNVVSLDCDQLGRPGSDFHLQDRKIKVHYLSGAHGLDFLDAVESDFARIISEGRSFLDLSTVLDDGVSHLIRAGQEQGSPLRVLRDADRARLERYALNTALRSLERIAELTDREVAQQHVRRTLERVGRVLDADGNWSDNLDVSLRLLKLALQAGDWDSCRELVARMDSSWGTGDRLRSSVRALFYQDREIAQARTWPWSRLLRYLHERRLQALCGAVGTEVPVSRYAQWLPNGLVVGRTSLRGVGLRRRANMLAAADLRARDRESDTETRDNGEWVFPEVAKHPSLRSRLGTIQRFVDTCTTLGDKAWMLPAARLFLCTRPPSYFDVARRLLYRTEVAGFTATVFRELLDTVNAIRGTEYRDPVGLFIDEATVAIPWHGPDGGSNDFATSRLILGNLPLKEKYWNAAATRVSGSTEGKPIHDLPRLTALGRVLDKAARAATYQLSDHPLRPSLLVLPELSLPRRWFRTVAQHVVRTGRFGLVVGLEYHHDHHQPYVRNQVYTVLPGPYSSVATWPWTKRYPAREEQEQLSALRPPVSFSPSSKPARRRTVVVSGVGRFSVLICSELIEAKQVADLAGRVELVVCPSWNRDTASYDHLIQSVGLQVHAFVAIANNGTYSDCRIWAPYQERWMRDVCRLVERHLPDVVFVDLPVGSIRAFHRGLVHGEKISLWRPLPPDWPS